MKTKILITGGSGFIGTNLLGLYSNKKEFELLNLDLAAPRNHQHKKFWVQTDILDKQEFVKKVVDFNPQYIVHLAARTDLEGQNSSDYAANTFGVINLIDACKKLNQLKRIGFASSRLVCRIGYSPQSENDVCPTTEYGKSKVQGEQLVRNSSADLPEWFIFRPTSILGPWFDIPYKTFFMNIYKSRYIHPADLIIKKSFGYVGNSVYQIDKLLFSQTQAHLRKTFFLCDYQSIEVKKWADLIAQRMDKPRVKSVPVFFLNVIATLGDGLKKIGYVHPPLTRFRLDNLMTNMVYETQLLEDVCGPLPFSIEQGVTQTLSWLKVRNIIE